MNCYLESTVPHGWPGGGGFSISNFSLQMLYKENLITNNYWTVTNDNMPLIRYLGCTITIYSQPEIDFLFYYNNTFPMVANRLTYMSTQPHIMLQLKHINVIKCRKYTKQKRQRKKIYVRPPSQMLNRWYLQHDIANVPLLQTLATACSLDRKYLHANAESTTIGLYCINTEEIQNHFFSLQQGTQGYTPKDDELIFAAPHADPKKITQIKIGDLIFLGQVYNNEEGTQIKSIPTGKSFPDKLTTALTNAGYQGNPFYKEWLHPDSVIVKTRTQLAQLKTKYTDANTTLNPEDFSLKSTYASEFRYNPFKDKGEGNKVYLVKILDRTHSHNWDPPIDEDIVWKNLPLWLLTWGYLDFQRKCGAQQQIDTNSCLVIETKYIEPQLTTHRYVPIDYTFYNGTSPYTDQLYPSDHLNWHPKVRYQVNTVNNIACTGPNTIKLPDNISCEAHIGYKFHFKVGGEPAPMTLLVDPQEQPAHTFPNNILQTTSLQNPTTPIEHFLWKFDERRHELTKKATKRITSYQPTEKTVLSITEPATTCPIASQKEIQTSDTSTSEEEEASIETQLLQHRREQKLLRKRINQLLQRLAILE